jgi:hypothetical protein
VQIINIFGGKESIDRRKAWEKVLLLRKPARRHMRVCGKHFLREDFINRKFHEFEVKSLVVYSTFFNSTQHFPKIAIEGICCSFSKVIQKDTRHRESLHQKLQAK